MREGVPEETGDPHHHVHPGPAELRQGHHLEAGHPPGGVVPGRPAAEQRQHLRDVVTLRAHGGGAPDGQAHRGRVGAGVGEMAGQQRVGERPAGLPGQPGRDRLRVDRVEVPPGRQHAHQPPGGRAGRPGRHEPAAQRPEHVGDLVGGPVQARHHLGGGEREHPLDLGVTGTGGATAGPAVREDVRAHPGRRGRVPARGIHAGDERAGGRLETVDLHPRGTAALDQTERGPQTRQRPRRAAPHLRRPQDRQHQVHPRVTGRGGAEDVQAVADLGVLHLAEVSVDMQQEVVEVVVAGTLVQPEIVVELGGLDERPDLRPDRRQLGRVERGQGGVLVQELFQPGHVTVGVGAGQRRHQMVDDDRVRPALGLRALPGIVDQEGVDQRQVAEDRVRRAPRRQAEALAGQPLQRAVFAQVHDRVRAELLVQPAVGGQVVVGRRQVRIVVDRHRVLPEPPRRLDHEQDVAEPQRGQHDRGLPPVSVRGPQQAAASAAGNITGSDRWRVDVEAAGRLTPVLEHPLAQGRRQRVEPAPVHARRHPCRGGRELLFGQPLDVVPAGGDEGVDERVPVGGDRPSARPVLAQVVAGGPQRGQQPDSGGRGVQAHGVADPGVLGRVRRQHQRDLLLGVRDVPQPGQPGGGPGQPGGALGIGHIAGYPVRPGLLERERHGDDPAVELGDRDLHGRVHRRQPRVAARPLRPRRRQAQALKHGYVECGERADVPRLLVPAGGRVRRAGAAGREHRHDQRVHPGQQREDVVGGRAQPAQGGGEHRPGIDPARLQRVAQHVHEGGVPGRRVRPVEHDTDGGAVRLHRACAVHPGGGHRRGRGEPEPGQQQRVGEEAVQLGEVRGTALHQVGQRLGGDAGRHGGAAHQVGVGQRLPAKDDRGQAGGERRGQAVRPCSLPPEQPDDHRVRAPQQVWDALGGEPGRVRHPPRHPAGPGRQQFGVGGGQQNDHRLAARTCHVDTPEEKKGSAGEGVRHANADGRHALAPDRMLTLAIRSTNGIPTAYCNRLGRLGGCSAGPGPRRPPWLAGGRDPENNGNNRPDTRMGNAQRGQGIQVTPRVQYFPRSAACEQAGVLVPPGGCGDG